VGNCIDSVPVSALEDPAECVELFKDARAYCKELSIKVAEFSSSADKSLEIFRVLVRDITTLLLL
jgi:hypothetical protein